MHAYALDTRRGPVTIRPLRSGDTGTVQAVLDRLSLRSLQLRFGFARPLSPRELELLARVDGERHVLVAWAGKEPVGVAHLARDDSDPAAAEIAYAVADEWQGLGVGRALGRLLATDAAAAGIKRVRAYIHPSNRASLAVMRRATTVLSTRLEDGDLHVVGAVA